MSLFQTVPEKIKDRLPLEPADLRLTPPLIRRGSFVLTEELLIVGTEDSEAARGRVQALDRHDDKMPIRWRYPKEGYLNYGRVVRYLVFIPEKNWVIIASSQQNHPFDKKDNELIAVDADSGDFVWGIDVQGSISAPVCVNNCVFFITDSTKKMACCISLDNLHEMMWQKLFDKAWMLNSIAVDGENLYIASKKHILCWYQTDGQERFLYELDQEHGIIVSNPLVTNRVVVLTTSAGFVIALDKQDGHQLWCQQKGRTITTGPIQWQDYVFVGIKADEPRTYQILALDVNTGEFAWNKPFTISTGQFYAPLSVYNNQILCGSNDKHVYALNGQTGELCWQYRMPKSIHYQPIVQDDKLYVVDRRYNVETVLLNRVPYEVPKPDVTIRIWLENGAIWYGIRKQTDVNERILRPHQLRNDLDGYIESIQEYLNRLAAHRLNPSMPDKKIQKDLQILGVRLYKELFSLEMQHYFWKELSQVKTCQLLLDSDTARVPWEIIVPIKSKVTDLVAQPLVCLSELFQIGRWIITPNEGVVQLQESFKISSLALLIGEDRLPGVQKEVAALQKHTHLNIETIYQYSDLEPMLKSANMGSYDGLHFIGHGGYAPEYKGTFFRFREGDAFDVTNLTLPSHTVFGQKKPFIFLNFCNSGHDGYALVNPQGWPTSFQDIGAACIVATLWNANDEAAALFADSFYQGLLYGFTVGEAMQQARQSIKNYGDATWLCYTLYGNPLAKADFD
ncbi:MAG TPA: PQQ-binding-like beta-propeller repeat protein [Anaerolineae bacterium]|nr:PQQ-binding-like beta-propeller repeat protein [Anaerolineae bacterium]